MHGTKTLRTGRQKMILFARRKSSSDRSFYAGDALSSATRRNHPQIDGLEMQKESRSQTTLYCRGGMFDAGRISWGNEVGDDRARESAPNR